MAEIVAVDVGGTHARFCRAEIGADGVPRLGAVHKKRVADFASLAECWQCFADDEGGDLPPAASIAFAAPIRGDEIRLTNSDWLIRPADLAQELSLDDLVLVNDFEAVGHAVSRLPLDQMEVLFGPDAPLPYNGVVTVLGIGTGLGVAMIAYRNGQPHVFATEGGHFDFAPLDETETRLIEALRLRYGRVSVERIVSGPGLGNIYLGLTADTRPIHDAELWAAALEGVDPLARQALDHLCLSYGSVAGDLALAHGPGAVVLVGGLTQRIKHLLPASGFHARFTAKGRYAPMMNTIPIRFASHDDIGLFGAAVAFGAKHL